MYQRARGAYIVVVERPHLMLGFARALQILKRKLMSTKAFNAYIQHSKANQDLSLQFLPLDINSVRLVVFNDASFASNLDLISQLCYVITMINSSRNANVFTV